jgi:hypothetical protein
MPASAIPHVDLIHHPDNSFMIHGFLNSKLAAAIFCRFLWDRTLRLLLPAIVYSCLAQPFLFWISDSSDSAMAAAYEAEAEEYGGFYVDALGNDLPVPPPHTMTLGECFLNNK